MNKTLLFLSKLFLMFLPAMALAGADQPWNDGGGGGSGSGPSLLLLAAVFIPYLYAMGRWPWELILLSLCAIAGGTVAQWFGAPFGWIVGIALAYKALSTRREDKKSCIANDAASSKDESNDVVGNEHLEQIDRTIRQDDSTPDAAPSVQSRQNSKPHRSQKAYGMLSTLKCPKCQQALRVPAEKLLDITCPKCRHIFRKFT